MATFTDLIEALSREPVFCTADGAEGRDWLWTLTVEAAGSAVDLSGTTGACAVKDAIDGTSLVTVTYAATAAGVVTLTAAASATAAKAGPFTQYGASRECVWSLVITKGAQSVALFLPSKFTIWQES